eukprot:gene19566-22245_t
MASTSKGKKKSKLPLAFLNEVIASKLYHESLDLRIRGAWRDAGDRLIKCADVYLFIKMLVEAACLYTEAAECYMHIDKGEALNAYKKSIKVYCDVGRFDIGGKLEQRLGYLNLHAQHWEDAAMHFRKAANFLSGDKLLDQSDHCLEKCAECLIQLGDYKEASHLYQMVSRSCVNSNLRRFTSLDHLLMSILCLMAIPDSSEPELVGGTPSGKSEFTSSPNARGGGGGGQFTPRSEEDAPLYQTKYDRIYSMNEQFDHVDFLWRRSKEKQFIRNLLKARAEMDLHAYTDHLYYWSNVRPLNNARTILLKVPMLEIKKAIEDEIRAEADRKAAAEARLIKKKKHQDRQQEKIEHPSLAGSEYSGDNSSFQETASVYSDKTREDAVTKATRGNTQMNARTSLEIDTRSDMESSVGGRSSIR